MAGSRNLYCLFARSGGPGPKGISCFLLPGDAEGLEVVERQEVIAPHPLAHLRFNEVRLPEEALVGAEGQGFRIAMSVLDVFRATVGAAALGSRAERFRRRRNACASASSSARPWPSCRWFRDTSRRWRSTSMPLRS